MAVFAASIMLSGCKDLNKPVARFVVEKEYGYSIFVSDYSIDASKVEYDFGDGSEVLTVKPRDQFSHTYQKTGIYTLKAVAYGKGSLHKDQKDETHKQLYIEY